MLTSPYKDCQSSLLTNKLVAAQDERLQYNLVWLALSTGIVFWPDLSLDLTYA
jgi:hypothetical protein